MRILHTSDWHIGRQFHNVSLLEDQQHVLQQIITIAASEKVDVVLIAGDLFDRAIPPAAAVKLVDETLNRLCNELAIPVILIAGNHDSPERLGFASRQLAEAKLFVSGLLAPKIEPICLQDEHGEVCFYPIPYADPATVNDIYATDSKNHDAAMAHITAQITQQLETRTKRAVAIAHCFIGGGISSDSERPLTVGGAEQVSYHHFDSFNYTALGHLHGPQSYADGKVRYSGSILKYSFSEENQRKSVTLVDLDAQGNHTVSEIALKPLRDLRTLQGSLANIMEQGQNDPHASDYLQISLTDTHAILDAMGTLRGVYPNTLHLQRPGLMNQNAEHQANRDLLKKNELAMFRDFYRFVRNEELDDAQLDYLQEIIQLSQQQDH